MTQTIGNQIFLTTEEAAESLGLAVDSVRRYCNQENPKIKGKKFGRDWLIPKSEIERYKKSQQPVGRPKKC